MVAGSALGSDSGTREAAWGDTHLLHHAEQQHRIVTMESVSLDLRTCHGFGAWCSSLVEGRCSDNDVPRRMMMYRDKAEDWSVGVRRDCLSRICSALTPHSPQRG